jgi:hypothetical protein
MPNSKNVKSSGKKFTFTGLRSRAPQSAGKLLLNKNGSAEAEP